MMSVLSGNSKCAVTEKADTWQPIFKILPVSFYQGGTFTLRNIAASGALKGVFSLLRQRVIN